MKRFLFLIQFLFLINLAHSQNLKGKVVNAQNGNPLAFVNILFDKTGRGVSCDIDGIFEIKDINGIQFLHFTYVGFRDTSIAISSINKSVIKVKMHPKSYQLKEVMIYPGANPAHRIIRACVKNRKLNNPEKLTSFSYTAYHKMIFTAKSTAAHQADSIVKGGNSLSIGFEENSKLVTDTCQTPAELDSTEQWEKNFFKSQHLFIMESVTERKFKRPDKNYEKVLGTRVSGLKDPMFAMVATQLQSFSFYQPQINLLDKNYINPISPGSLSKYYFIIEDTIYKGVDSVFVISFRPFKDKNFDGMRGVLYINSNKFAIQNVIARPADTSESLGITIQQKYELIEGKYWFPVQLNTNLEFTTISLNNEALVGIGKSYLKNIKIDPPMKAVRFNNVVLDIDRQSGKRDTTFWNQHRVLQLDSLETKTYQVIDSIGKAEHFDRTLWILRTLTNGYIPWGPINMEIDKFFQYNEFEGFRMGLSLKTNDRMARWVQLGAYGAWATRDYQWKYGGSINFLIHHNSQTHLLFEYKHDVTESAAQESFSRNSFYNTDIYRNFLIKQMNYTNSIKAELRFRAITNFSWKLGVNIFDKLEKDPYIPSLNPAIQGDILSQFQEAYIETRFAYKEKIIRNPLYQVSLGTKYPILHIRFTHGQYTNSIQNNIFSAYDRLEMQIKKSFFIRYLGTSSFTIQGGMIQSDVNMPWYQLYNGRGSYAAFYLESPNSFGTMRLNEFLSDQYFSIYYRHDFKDLLFGNKQFVPQPEFITNFTIGSLRSDAQYPNIQYNTLEKGYFESGIMLNSILKSGISTIGIGAFYRYGAYSFTNEMDNFAFKFSLKYAL
jgi:hypothetical protein